MDRVGITNNAYFYEDSFLEMLEIYESQLEPKVGGYIEEMRTQLDQNPLDE